MNLEYLLDPAVHVDARVIDDLTEAWQSQSSGFAGWNEQKETAIGGE